MAIVMGSTVFIAAVIVKKGKDVVASFVNGFLTIIMANAPQGLPGIDQKTDLHLPYTVESWIEKHTYTKDNVCRHSYLVVN